jgi:hypothetical protein
LVNGMAGPKALLRSGGVATVPGTVRAVDCYVWGGGPAKKKTTRTPREGNAGRFAFWLAGGGEFASPFFFRRRSLTERLRFDLWSSCFYSQMACDLLVHQFERCRSAESRISLLRGTSRRYCDVDETRDWSRHSKQKTINSRLGDDSIWSDLRTRKRQLSYPQR